MLCVNVFVTGERMFSSSLEKYWKTAVDLGKGQHMPITGLAYFNVENTKR